MSRYPNPMTSLVGAPCAQALYDRIPLYLSRLPGPVTLAIVQVGDDPASHVYIKKKQETAHLLGIQTRILKHPAHTSENTLRTCLHDLNHDPDVHGIILQLPLPDTLDARILCELIHPQKDVDGLTALNQGRLLQGDRGGLIPCTPLGCLWMLRFYEIPLRGVSALVIGRSRLVGMPMSILLTHAHATVTLAHSHTHHLTDLLKNHTLLVVAVGKKEYLDAQHFAPGTLVLDVGIHRTQTGLTGDVLHPKTAQDSTSVRYSPVPGGVGPMTVACLMLNTVKAAHAHYFKKELLYHLDSADVHAGFPLGDPTQ